MTLRQKKLVENYIRRIVVSEMTQKNRLNEMPDQIEIKRVKRIAKKWWDAYYFDEDERLTEKYGNVLVELGILYKDEDGDFRINLKDKSTNQYGEIISYLDREQDKTQNYV